MDAEELHADPGEAEAPASPAPPSPSDGGHDAPADEPADSEPGEPTEPERAGPPANGDEHGGEVARDLEELIAKAQRADEYLQMAQRARADFENFRRRAARDAAAAQERGVVRLARELLPAIDNLERALAAIPEGADEGLSAGIRLVHGDVVAAFGRVGVEPFSPEGEAFDPTYHEAVAQQPVEGAEPGTVVEVYQRGYRFGESVLRPARVMVAG